MNRHSDPAVVVIARSTYYLGRHEGGRASAATSRLHRQRGRAAGNRTTAVGYDGLELRAAIGNLGRWGRIGTLGRSRNICESSIRRAVATATDRLSPVPVAVTLKFAVCPAVTVVLCGDCEIAGGEGPALAVPKKIPLMTALLPAVQLMVIVTCPVMVQTR